ncbi:MAG: hypothetical protein ACI4SG_09000 [Oligosphaeraceae bacterium]
MKNILSLCLPALLSAWLTASCVTKAPEPRAFLLDPLPPDTPCFDVSVSNLYNSQVMRYATEHREVKTIPHARWALPLKDVCSAATPVSYTRAQFTLHVREVQDQGASRALVFRAALFPHRKGQILTHVGGGEQRVVTHSDNETVNLIPLEISIPYEGELDALAFRDAYSEFLRQAARRMKQLLQENPPPQNP